MIFTCLAPFLADLAGQEYNWPTAAYAWPDAPTENAEFRSNCLLVFTAEWCGPCRNMKSTLEDLKKHGWNVCTYPDVVPVKGGTIILVDVDRYPDLKERFDITAMPTLIKLETWKRTRTHVGALYTMQAIADFYNGK